MPKSLLALGLVFALIACGNASSTGGGAAGASGAGAAAGSGGALGGAGGNGTSAGAGGTAATAGGPSGGGGLAAAGGGSVAFADVQSIFNDRCVLCHDKSKVGLPSYPKLSLVEGDSRAALLNQPALETCGGKYVVPGQPSQSYLVHKVSDAQPCDGSRMPAPFEVLHMVPLTAAQIATISAWIAAGAH